MWSVVCHARCQINCLVAVDGQKRTRHWIQLCDPDLDDIPKDIDKKGLMEGENTNPHLAENTGPGIILRNNPGPFMIDVDPDAAFAREFLEYTNIVLAYLLDDEFDDEELFIVGMREYVLGTVTDLQTLPYKGPNREIQLGKRVFHRLFWTFEPCVRVFPHFHELEPRKFRQRFTRLESQMSFLPTNLRTWLGSIENWQWNQSYDKWFRLATSMPRMGLKQAKHIEAGHEYVEVVRKAIAEVPLPAFEMMPDRSIHRHPKGRPQLTRIRNDIDVSETGELKLCTVRQTSRHNQSTCSHRIYVSDQSSRNVKLEDDELYTIERMFL
ncbi:hypothetical protein GOBAR_DD17461 [Gossypium barbadense]|nr:hypothetical protein GOBAR_DD17461 [Gossypium barbadense]